MPKVAVKPKPVKVTKPIEAPEVSLVLSCYDRPDLLPMSLGSIFAQSMKDFNVLVTDNAPSDAIAAKHQAIVDYFASLDKRDGRDPRFLYCRTSWITRVKDDPYWSAEWGVGHLRQLGRLGRWIGTPCDDTQYFPLHLQTLLTEAARNLWECVTVGTPVIGPAGPTRSSAGYALWDCGMWASKTTYLVRSKHWIGFPGKPRNPGPAASDTAMIQELQRRGVPMGQVRQPTMAHN
jgi:glycosyltransferase involved in cell wall biosynthesis